MMGNLTIFVFSRPFAEFGKTFVDTLFSNFIEFFIGKSLFAVPDPSRVVGGSSLPDPHGHVSLESLMDSLIESFTHWQTKKS